MLAPPGVSQERDFIEGFEPRATERCRGSRPEAGRAARPERWRRLPTRPPAAAKRAAPRGAEPTSARS
eukprot:4676148-Alexandrium_andersonii.AAC.1